MNTQSNTTSSSTLTAVVSLGSNLPYSGQSPAELVLAAMAALSEISVDSRSSSLYLSEPQECPPGAGDYINAVMLLFLPTSLSPSGLLAQTQAIELQFGRQRGTEQNRPRSLDIDIISFDSQVLETAELSLPHPRAAQRRFVLLPLAEIAEEMVLPSQSATVSQLLHGLADQESVRLAAVQS